MKEQTDEPIYAEANNNFLKEVSSFGTPLVRGLRTTLNILLNVNFTEGLLESFHVIRIGWVEQQEKHSSPISNIYN